MNKLAKVLMAIALAAPLSLAGHAAQANTLNHNKTMTVAAVPATNAQAAKTHHYKHHARHKAHARKHSYTGVKPTK
jgi:hypothetical protein